MPTIVPTFPEEFRLFLNRPAPMAAHTRRARPDTARRHKKTHRNLYPCTNGYKSNAAKYEEIDGDGALRCPVAGCNGVAADPFGLKVRRVKESGTPQANQASPQASLDRSTTTLTPTGVRSAGNSRWTARIWSRHSALRQSR
jgi:hypothetical protein